MPKLIISPVRADALRMLAEGKTCEEVAAALQRPIGAVEHWHKLEQKRLNSGKNKAERAAAKLAATVKTGKPHDLPASIAQETERDRELRSAALAGWGNPRFPQRPIARRRSSSTAAVAARLEKPGR